MPMTDFSQWMSGPVGNVGTGFVNPGRWLALNQGAGQSMAGQVAHDLAPSNLKDDAARQERAGLVANGGLGTVLADDYARGQTYSPGQMSMDAFLTQGVGGNALKAAVAKARATTPPVQTPPTTAAPLPSGLPANGPQARERRYFDTDLKRWMA